MPLRQSGPHALATQRAPTFSVRSGSVTVRLQWRHQGAGMTGCTLARARVLRSEERARYKSTYNNKKIASREGGLYTSKVAKQAASGEIDSLR